MSILSLGAIFLIGGVMALTTSLITATVGTAAILSENNQSNQQTNYNPELIYKNTNEEEQKMILNQHIQRLNQVINQSMQNKENIHKKDYLLNKVREALYHLDKQQYHQLQEEVSKVVREFNETLISEELINSQKKQLVDQIHKLKPLLKDQNDSKKIQEISVNYKNYLLNEIEEFYNHLERKYLNSQINIVSSNIENNLVDDKIKDRLISKINDYLSKIKELDDQYYQELISKYSGLQDRDESYIKLLLDQVKIDLGRINTKKIRTNIYKLQLKSYINLLKGYLDTSQSEEDFRQTTYYSQLLKLIQKSEDMLNEKYINKEDFYDLQNAIVALLNDIQKYFEYVQLKESIKKDLYETLDKLGYKLIDTSIMEKLANGELVYIDLPYDPDYKVQVKLTKDNRIYFRLVKFSEYPQPTEYEKQKDYEIAKKWCQDYDKILNLLRQNGIFIETLQRLEPEQTEISYILKEKQQIQKQEQKYMQLE